MPLVFVRFLREDCIDMKKLRARNGTWNAGEKHEKKSLRSTLTYFDDDYFLKKDNDFTIECGEFYCNAMVF